MQNNKYFSVGAFAKLARTTKDALIYYDKIGLLSPSSHGNKYHRYYSPGQLAVVNVIHTLQEIGMSLTDIKAIADNRTPEIIDEMLLQKVEEIGLKVDNLSRARRLMWTLRKSIHSAVNVDEDAITIQFMPERAIVLGDINDYSDGKSDYDALLSFYHKIGEKYLDIDLNYPVWAIFSEERIKKGEWKYPDRYYFYNPNGNDKIPAFFYAIGYKRGGYGEGDELYKRLVDYIDRNGFEICGDAYEEYPLNEICVTEENNYLMRVMISVREKHAHS